VCRTYGQVIHSGCNRVSEGEGGLILRSDRHPSWLDTRCGQHSLVPHKSAVIILENHCLEVVVHLLDVKDDVDMGSIVVGIRVPLADIKLEVDCLKVIGGVATGLLWEH